VSFLILIFGKSSRLLRSLSQVTLRMSSIHSFIIHHRSISIISHIAKLLESLVLKSILRPINKIIIDEQHGFRPGHSVTTCNLIFIEYAFEAFSKHSQVDFVYLDFTKAFDRVNHRALMSVLLNLGFGEHLLSWFSSYLSERIQVVKIDGFCSFSPYFYR